MGGSVAPGWWRRNAWALGAVIALATASLWITTARERSDYFDYRASQPVVAAPGDTLELDGTTFTVVEVERLYPGGLPLGTAALRVLVDVAATTGGKLPEGCLLTLAEAGGSAGDRTWGTGSASTVDFLPVEGTETLCPSEPTGDYTLAATFVVPGDIDGTLTLRVEVPESFPQFPALVLGPLP